MRGESHGGYVDHYLACLRAALALIRVVQIEDAGNLIVSAWEEDRQVFVAGNGGSAATASHLAADLTRCFAGADRGLRVSSLADGTALVTGLANDLGYDRVFAAQLDGVIRAGDVLVALSASGRSTNVVLAMESARDADAAVIALLGGDGGEAVELADVTLLVPESDPPLVEDLHLLLAHALAGYVGERVRAHAPTPL